MKKILSPIIPLGISFLLGGCPSETPSSKAVRPSPSPEPSPPAPTFNQEIKNSPVLTTVPGLIPPTNPARQRTEVVVGRIDPFALVPVQPTVTPKKSERPAQKSPPVAPKTVQKPSSLANKSSLPKPPLPPLPPQPTAADQVLVSGIIQLPTTAIAIVQAPGERTVRSVQAGDTISNGQVLVKAIYANPENPLVILEQHGIQVMKKLGQQATSPDSASTTS